MVTVAYPFVWHAGGGSVESGLLAAYGLSRRGAHPVVFLPYGADDIKARASRLGLEARYYTPYSLGSFEKGKLWSFLGKEWRMLAIAYHAVKALRERRCDVVHINDDSAMIPWALAARLTGAKVIWHLRSGGKGIRDVARSRLAHKIVPISEYVSTRLPGNQKLSRPLVNPVDDERYFGSAGGVAEESFCGSGSRIRLMYVGRPSWRKRPEWAIAAFCRLRMRFPDLQLSLTILGEFDHEVEQLLAPVALDAQASVEFPGRVADPERFYRRSDILIHPAFREPLGRIFLEAAAMGIPAVGMRGGGAEDVVLHGRTGYLCEEDNFEGFVSMIETLIANPEKRLRMGVQAREYAEENFTVDAYADRLVEIVGEVSDLSKAR